MRKDPKPKATVLNSYSSKDHVRVLIPVPPLGESSYVEFKAHGLRVLVERVETETPQQARARFVSVGPIGRDTRIHAARMGTGQAAPKKLGITVCTEGRETPLPSGPRLQGLDVEHVSCQGCRRVLVKEGVELGTNENEEES